MRARARLLLGSTLALLVTSACSALLGIDFPPLRPDPPGPPPVCAENDPEPCRCAHAFCRDFEEGGIELTDWRPPERFQNPLIVGRGSVGFDSGVGGSRYLGVTFIGSDTTGGALLTSTVPEAEFGDPARLDGVRMSFDARFDKVVIPDDSGGPIPGTGTGLVAGFVNDTGDSFSGPMLVLGEQGVYLAVLIDFFPKTGRQASRERITPAGFRVASTFAGQWGKMTIFSGTAERALTLGYEGCPANARYVIAASWTVSKLCLPAPADYDIRTLPKRATIVIGPLLKGPGELVLGYDNVQVDAYPPPSEEAGAAGSGRAVP